MYKIVWSTDGVISSQVNAANYGILRHIVTIWCLFIYYAYLNSYHGIAVEHWNWHPSVHVQISIVPILYRVSGHLRRVHFSKG